MRSWSKIGRSTTNAALISGVIEWTSASVATRSDITRSDGSAFGAADGMTMFNRRREFELRAPSGLRLAVGSRCAQKFDEAGKRNAEAHAANHELKNIDFANVRKFGSLMQIKEAERSNDQRQDDTGHDVARLAGHSRLHGSRILLSAGRRGPVK